MNNTHSFHIPVMGIGYTIDTPLKVSQYGINSVISLVDDILMEKLRKMYCQKFGLPYHEVTAKFEDFRALRISSYLNLINQLSKDKYEEILNSVIDKKNELITYSNLLPDSSKIKQEFKNIIAKYTNKDELKKWLKTNLSMGSIDVNIMTKVDKINYRDKVKLPFEYNDAHAALRGYANSDLTSSLILSAGLNPRLYSYIEQFDDFFPEQNGQLKKKIVLKVSDYRSAFIQGKFLAKKGIWVSEYRIESGLNCGGHAFATDGHLLGPVLAEFRDNREDLIETIHEIFVNALTRKCRPVPKHKMPLKITAQGGVGTSQEHQFLIEEYNLSSVGWGTPFLLTPEATTVDDDTLQKLIQAKEKDLYLSHISPLGIPFNNLRANTKDLEKKRLIEKDRPGSSCPKKFVSFNHEFTEQDICLASRQYQKLKLEELDEKNLPKKGYHRAFDKITEKSCICVGLGTSALLAHGLDTKTEGVGVSICPGPNLAYFSSITSLKEMVDHIYNRSNVITRTDRPNIFIKELRIYMNYLSDKLAEAKTSTTRKQLKGLSSFVNNLKGGIRYYETVFHSNPDTFKETKTNILPRLKECKLKLLCFERSIEHLKFSYKNISEEVLA